MARDPKGATGGLGLVVLRLRSELRARWRVSIVLAVLLGIGGGVSLTALAGARRSDSALRQFVTFSLPDDGGFLYGSVGSPPRVPGQPADSLALSAVERRIVELPQVVAHFRAPYLFVVPVGSSEAGGSLNVVGAADPDLLRTVDRPLVVAGRLPDPNRPFDVVVNELAADQHHLHVGSVVHLRAYTAAQSMTLTGSVETHRAPPKGPRFTVRVAAIARFVQDVNAVLPIAARADVSYEEQQYLYVTPAFVQRLAAGLGVPASQIQGMNLVGVRLRHGRADWPEFASAAARIGKSEVFTSPGNVYAVHLAASSAQRGIHLEVISLLLFGGLAALVTLLLVGQAVSRQTRLEGEDYERLRNLGATSRQLLGVVLARTALVGVGGGILALLIAVAASPLMPIGLARQAEIHRGLSFDPAVLLDGAVGLAVLLVGWSAVTGWRVASRQPAEVAARPGLVSSLVTRGSIPPAMGMGVRFGLERGRGQSAIPITSALVATTIAITTLTATLVFGTSLHRLETSPRQQGWNWDALVGNPNDLNDREAQVSKILSHNPEVAGYSAIAILGGASQGSAFIDGQNVHLLLAFDPLKGAVYPPLVAGHAPRADDQIVLGRQTLAELHRKLGESVHIATPSGVRTLRIVGEMISPSVGDLFTNQLGQGGWIYGPALKAAVQTPLPANTSATPPTVFNMFAVRYKPGVDPAAAYRILRREFGADVLRQLPSEDVVNLESVDGLPLILSALVALLGVATVANALVSSIHRRRRELAVLKTIGFTTGQMTALVAWQATTFCLASLLLGIPLGLLGGVWGWRLVANGLGSVSAAAAPALAIGLAVPAVLAIGNAVAAVPGRVAARVGPAVILRTR